MRRMFDETQLGGGGKEIIVLPSGTDIKTYNWADHEDGARFKGSNLLGIPEEITQTKNFVIELHKFDDKAFALTLYHTGLYNEHVGTYIIYHYSDKFQDNWTRIDKQESGGGGGAVNLWTGNSYNIQLTPEQQNKLSKAKTGIVTFTYNNIKYTSFITFQPNNLNTSTTHVINDNEVWRYYISVNTSNPLVGKFIKIVYNLTNNTFTSSKLNHTDIKFTSIDIIE